MDEPEEDNPDLADGEAEEGGEAEAEVTTTEVPAKVYEDRGVCKGRNRKDDDPNGDVIEDCFCKAQAQDITVTRGEDEFKWGPEFSVPYVEETIAGNWCNDYDIKEPTCCNHIYMQELQTDWLAAYPARCFDKEENRRYAIIIKNLMCMGCHPDQYYLTNKNIIEVEEPVYIKVDPNCDPVKHKKDVRADCPRTREYELDDDGNPKRGTYRVEESDKYFVYVEE